MADADDWNQGNQVGDDATTYYHAGGGDDDAWYDPGWEEYEETSEEPEWWFEPTIVIISVVIMLVVLPLLVYFSRQHAKKLLGEKEAEDMSILEAPSSERVNSFNYFLCGDDRLGNPGNANATSNLPVDKVPTYLQQHQEIPSIALADSFVPLDQRTWSVASTSSKAASIVSKTSASLEKHDDYAYIKDTDNNIPITLRRIFTYDKETERILGYAVPFALTGLSTSVANNICLALVAHYAGAKQVSAYAIVGLLVGLTDQFLQGPMSACAVLCSHAIGASNNFLAGQYVQLAILLHLITGIPIIYLWITYMDRFVLFLEWGDEDVAEYALEYVQVMIWKIIMDSCHLAIEQLLDITGHEIFTTLIGIGEGITNVTALAIIVSISDEINLRVVGSVYVTVSIVSLCVTLTVSYHLSWLKPFRRGITRAFAASNAEAVKNMLKTAVPLSFALVLSNAEWVLLTHFAAKLGPAEVGAWAILGSVWELFDVTSWGIGESAEIRVAYHLGNNHPNWAKLSAYKSLGWGMVAGSVVTAIFYSNISRIPGWFTPDETLQVMIANCLPILCFGSLVLTFGMLSLFLLGAQGRYKLGTWITFVVSWGITIPLGAMFIYAMNLDLRGLSAAVVLGYVGAGAALSYVLLASNWAERANKIQKKNAAIFAASGRMDDEDEKSASSAGSARTKSDRMDDVCVAIAAQKSRAARLQTRKNIRLFSAPPGELGITIDKTTVLEDQPGILVTEVAKSSPFFGRIFPGDSILAIDFVDVTSCSSVEEVYLLLDGNNNGNERRQLTVCTTPIHYRDHQPLLDVGDFEVLTPQCCNPQPGDPSSQDFEMVQSDNDVYKALPALT